MFSDTQLLDKAIDVTKAYYDGGGSKKTPDVALREIYTELKKINSEMKTSDRLIA